MVFLILHTVHCCETCSATGDSLYYPTSYCHTMPTTPQLIEASHRKRFHHQQSVCCLCLGSSNALCCHHNWHEIAHWLNFRLLTYSSQSDLPYRQCVVPREFSAFPSQKHAIHTRMQQKLRLFSCHLSMEPRHCRQLYADPLTPISCFRKPALSGIQVPHLVLILILTMSQSSYWIFHTQICPIPLLCMGDMAFPMQSLCMHGYCHNFNCCNCCLGTSRFRSQVSTNVLIHEFLLKPSMLTSCILGIDKTFGWSKRAGPGYHVLYNMCWTNHWSLHCTYW